MLKSLLTIIMLEKNRISSSIGSIQNYRAVLFHFIICYCCLCSSFHFIYLTLYPEIKDLVSGAYYQKVINFFIYSFIFPPSPQDQCWGRRKNRRGRIEGNCGLLPILLNFFSVRFRERKQDKKEYLPLKKQCKACFDRNFSKSARIWSRFCRDCPHGVQKPMVSSFLAKERILRVQCGISKGFRKKYSYSLQTYYGERLVVVLWGAAAPSSRIAKISQFLQADAQFEVEIM